MKSLNEQEIRSVINDLVELGYLNRVGADSVQLTLQGRNRSIDLMTEFVGVLKTCKDFVSVPDDMLTEIAIQSITETFGNEVMFLVYLTGTKDWKDQIKDIVEMPLDELKQLVNDEWKNETYEERAIRNFGLVDDEGVIKAHDKANKKWMN